MTRTGKAVTAITQKDGTVHFPPAARPIGLRLLDWMLILLWCLVGGVLVAAALAI